MERFHGQAVEFRWSRMKIWLLMAPMLVFIGAPGVFLLPSPHWEARALGVLWMAVPTFGIAWSVRLSWTREVVVKIDPFGILDRRISNHSLRWAEIREIELLRGDDMNSFGLSFHNPKSVLANAKWFVRWMAPVNRAILNPSVSISMDLLDGWDVDFLGAVDKFRPEPGPIVKR